MSFDADIVVVGAGVVGLAIASRVSNGQRNVFVLERHSAFGQETSSRNSEVIHAGIYYPKDSLKAKLCVQGASMLYALCEKHHIACQRIGKLIVAIDKDQEASLHELKAKGEANGVEGLSLMNANEIRHKEPHVQARAALLIENNSTAQLGGLIRQQTGIFIEHAFLKYDGRPPYPAEIKERIQSL